MGKSTHYRKRRQNNFSTIYEKFFQPGLDLIDKMFQTSQIKQNIIKMTIYKGTILAKKFQEGENYYKE